MKIQYLGTAAAEGVPALFCECERCKKSRELGGRNIRSRSQAIIDDKILIDFPADTFMHFINYNLPLYAIKTCLVTHSHSDHLYPADISMRIGGFANVTSVEPLTFYSDENGYNMIKKEIERSSIPECDVRTVKILPLEPFEVEGYKVTAIRANHDPASSPVLFVIEKDGKSIFYGNDTGYWSEEGTDFLKNLEKPLSVVSLDCTMGCNVNKYWGHYGFEECVDVKNTMLREKIADENTIFILNHFSHNGPNIVYDEFTKIAAKEGFDVTYDGMILEF